MSERPERVTVRIFINGRCRRVDHLEIRSDEAAQGFTAVAEEQIEYALQTASGQPFLIELEFLDEPDESQRFCRFGTDTHGMRAPREMPNHWKLEESGKLAPAVVAYLAGKAMTGEQIAAMRAYLRQWINKGDWRGAEIDGLRDAVNSLHSEAQIRTWLAKAATVGIDPLL